MQKIEGLNSLRFFAFFAIFLFHSAPIFKYGYLGVDFFFVLSSFLLTYLALTENKETNRFSRKNFFMRRVLRIFPLYYLIVFLSFCVFPFFTSLLNLNLTLPDNKLLYWLLLSNYEQTDCVFYLKFLWSISVEEQFYLLFIALSFLLFRSISAFIGVLSISYFLFMSWALNNEISTYTHTITHFSNFAVGVAGAKLFFDKKELKYWPELFLSISIPLLIFTNNEILFNIWISFFAISLILICIKHSKKIIRYPIFKTTEFLGKYTYGLYVYSGLVITFGNKYMPLNNLYLRIAFNLIILIFVAILSYHLFEKHFLKLKSKFR